VSFFKILKLTSKITHTQILVVFKVDGVLLFYNSDSSIEMYSINNVFDTDTINSLYIYCVCKTVTLHYFIMLAIYKSCLGCRRCIRNHLPY